MQIDYKFDSKPLDDAVTRLIARGQDMTPITRAIAAVLASESEDAFEHERAPSTGQPWPALSDAYREKLAKQGKTGKMLQRSAGGLAMSLSTEFDAVSAAIATNKIYGPLQQLGGAPGMPPGPAAVPAREHMGLSPAGADQIVDIINETLAKATSG